MGLLIINSGTIEGDGTGDHGKVMVDKLKTMLAEIYARLGDGSLNIALSVSSTDDLDPGGGFPSGIITLEFTVTTVSVAKLNGLKAGIPGQILFIKNAAASTGELDLVNEASSSQAPNRFDGYTDAALSPGMKTPIQYHGNTINRWDM